jgi:hypothetical protein
LCVKNVKRKFYGNLKRFNWLEFKVLARVLSLTKNSIISEK